jgi:hypothetical protein
MLTLLSPSLLPEQTSVRLRILNVAIHYKVEAFVPWNLTYWHTTRMQGLLAFRIHQP